MRGLRSETGKSTPEATARPPMAPPMPPQVHPGSFQGLRSGGPSFLLPNDSKRRVVHIPIRCRPQLAPFSHGCTSAPNTSASCVISTLRGSWLPDNVTWVSGRRAQSDSLLARKYNGRNKSGEATDYHEERGGE